MKRTIGIIVSILLSLSIIGGVWAAQLPPIDDPLYTTPAYQSRYPAVDAHVKALNDDAELRRQLADAQNEIATLKLLRAHDVLTWQRLIAQDRLEADARYRATQDQLYKLQLAVYGDCTK